MKKQFNLLLAITALVFATLACQALQPGIGLAPSVSVPTAPPAVAVSTTAPIVVASGSATQQEALSSLYQNVLPGIVAIQVNTAQGGSLGTGIVFDNQGHVVTNQHVVGSAKQVKIRWSDGFETSGQVVRTHAARDVAVQRAPRAPPDGAAAATRSRPAGPAAC